MRSPRPSSVVQAVVIGILLATPTILLVAGALLLGLNNDQLETRDSSTDLITVVDPEFGVGDQYLEPSLIKNAPIDWNEAESLIGSPILISIRALEMHSSVIPVSAYSGVMEIPEDISKIGWFVGSVAPGADQGSAVLVGHRDGVEGGRGSFFGIEELSHGDRISVTTSEGVRLRYSVIEVELVDKDDIPIVSDFVFAREGDPRLTLITCGGIYNADTGGYQSNVIVTAVPIETS